MMYVQGLHTSPVWMWTPEEQQWQPGGCQGPPWGTPEGTRLGRAAQLASHPSATVTVGAMQTQPNLCRHQYLETEGVSAQAQVRGKVWEMRDRVCSEDNRPADCGVRGVWVFPPYLAVWLYSNATSLKAHICKHTEFKMRGGTWLIHLIN